MALIEAFSQVDELELEDLGDAWKHEYVFDDDRRPGRVGAADHLGALRHVGHSEVGFGSAITIVVANHLFDRFGTHDRALEGRRHAFDRHVVMRGSDSATGEDQIVGTAQSTEILGDGVDLIGADDDTPQLDAQRE